MQTTWILYPLFAMALLTLFVALRMLLLRIKAVRSGDLSVSYFRTNAGGEEPDALRKTTQHYDNLFEMPVLFYLVVIVIFISNSVDVVQLVLAWAYFLLCVAHAYIHIGYNNVLHRMKIFLFSTVVMYSMWFVWFGKTLFF